MVRISQQLYTEQSASVSVSKDLKETCNTARAKCFLSSIFYWAVCFPKLVVKLPLFLPKTHGQPVIKSYLLPGNF